MNARVFSVSGLSVLLGLFLTGCGQPAAKIKDTAKSETKAEVWTCSMHPQIKMPGPGKCPICSMDLIPLTTSSGQDSGGSRTLVMSDSALALAEVETTPVLREYPEVTVRLVGQLDYDETQMRSLTARFPARIEQLFVNYTGVSVEKGEHLARVYSPELLTAQRELLSAHAADPNGVLYRIARDKLRLWDLLPEQIDEILQQGEPADDFELKAPMGGVVVAKKIKEGDYVKTGDALLSIADLGELWLHLQAYESDISKLRYGQKVDFSVEAWPGETFNGTIAFISPEVDPRTRTIAVRVNVLNTDGRLKPGMFAKGQVRVKLAANNQVFLPELAGKWISPMHPEIVKDGPGKCDICGMDLVPAETLGYTAKPSGEAPLLVPSSAVLRTGKRAVVYVKIKDADQPSFEGREIELGTKTDDGFVVVSGLSEGDEVVTHGAFKIDSALQIEAKPSMMNPQGGGPVPGHHHGGEMQMAPQSDDGKTMDALSIHPSEVENLLPEYYALQAALGTDKLPEAKDALKALMAKTGHGGPMGQLIHTMLAAEDLEAMRRPYFDRLSQVFVDAVKAAGKGVLSAKVYHMRCPMVYPGKAADWLQSTDNLRNPYFGEEMPDCGELVEVIE